MISVLTNLSNIIIPLFIFYITAYGLLMRRNIYEDFVNGAKQGAKTVVGIMPTLVGLMVAVYFACLRFPDFSIRYNGLACRTVGVTF